MLSESLIRRFGAQRQEAEAAAAAAKAAEPEPADDAAEEAPAAALSSTAAQEDAGLQPSFGRAGPKVNFASFRVL